MRCPGCGTEVSPVRQSCPLCQALIHADELKRLAREAEEAEGDRPADALNTWRRALELLPPESVQARAIAQRAEALSRRAEAEGIAAPGGQAGGLRGAWKGGGVVAVLAFLLTKAKFLLLGLTKIGTLGTMLLSLGVYWSIFGWRLALGLILSIYVHEMGHVAALHRLGFPASAPTFIPGLGAFIRLKQRPVSPREDARVGLAGPIWGLGAALVAWGVYLAGGGPIWAAVARLGAWINLFNLLPLGPLDGGRAFGALSKAQKLALVVWIAGVWFFVREGLLILLLLGAVIWLFNPRKAAADLPEGDRLAFLQYAGLVVVLAALTLLKVPGTP
ncbi:MAG TPA: site-2 protease family protein [Thermoanaerobaculia bacterium]|jgi:Zn-dependent protease|nr:site-2 protease family protein [Thermoanaerobaculia bacterium]